MSLIPWNHLFYSKRGELSTLRIENAYVDRSQFGWHHTRLRWVSGDGTGRFRIIRGGKLWNDKYRETGPLIWYKTGEVQVGYYIPLINLFRHYRRGRSSYPVYKKIVQELLRNWVEVREVTKVLGTPNRRIEYIDEEWPNKFNDKKRGGEGIRVPRL